MESRKTDEGRLEVTKTETVTKTNTYDIEFLISQKKAIQEQKDRDNAQRDIELAEVEGLIAECEKLGIKAKEIV